MAYAVTVLCFLYRINIIKGIVKTHTTKKPTSFTAMDNENERKLNEEPNAMPKILLSMLLGDCEGFNGLLAFICFFLSIK